MTYWKEKQSYSLHLKIYKYKILFKSIFVKIKIKWILWNTRCNHKWTFFPQKLENIMIFLTINVIQCDSLTQYLTAMPIGITHGSSYFIKPYLMKNKLSGHNEFIFTVQIYRALRLESCLFYWRFISNYKSEVKSTLDKKCPISVHDLHWEKKYKIINNVFKKETF